MPSINPVVIEFIAKGVPDVARAFTNLANIFEQAEKLNTKSVEQGVKNRLRKRNEERAETTRMYARMFDEAEERDKKHAAKVKEIQKSIDKDNKDLAAKRKKRETELAKDIVDINKALNKELHKITTDAIAADKKASTEKRKRAREDAKFERDINRDMNREINGEIAKNARLRKEAEKQKRDAERETRDQLRKNMWWHDSDRLGRSVVHGASRGLSTINRAATSVAHQVLNIGGGFTVADSIKSSLEVRGALADLANRSHIIQPGKPGGGPNAQLRTVDELHNRAKAEAIQWGVSQGDVVAAMDKFVEKTGRLDVALGSGFGDKNSIVHGVMRMSRAGAGSQGDLASTAAEIFNALGPEAKSEDVFQIMRTLHAQGKLGNIEFRDLAKYSAKIVASSGMFEGSKGDVIGKFGALAQISRGAGGGSNNPAEASTAVAAFTSQFYKNARRKEMLAAGVDVQNKETGLNRDPVAIIKDMFTAAEKQSRASGHGLADFGLNVGKMVGDVRARRLTLGLEKVYLEAASRGEDGRAAVDKKLAETTGNVQTVDEEMDAAKRRLLETDVKLNQAMEQLRQSAADQLLPVLKDQLVPILTEAMPKIRAAFEMLADLARFAIEHPWEVVFGVLIGNMGKALVAEIISAKIGDMIRGHIERGIVNNPQLPGTGGLAAPPGTGGSTAPASSGGAGALGWLAAIAVGGGALWEVGSGYTKAVNAGYDKRMQLEGAMASGDPAKAANARAELERLQKKNKTWGPTEGVLNTVSQAVNAVINPVSFLASKTLQGAAGQGLDQRGSQNITEMIALGGKKFDSLIEALDRNTKAVSNQEVFGPQLPSSGVHGLPDAPMPLRGKT